MLQIRQLEFQTRLFCCYLYGFFYFDVVILSFKWILRALPKWKIPREYENITQEEQDFKSNEELIAVTF